MANPVPVSKKVEVMGTKDWSKCFKAVCHVLEKHTDESLLEAAEASLLSLLNNLPMTADNWACIVCSLNELHGRCFLKRADGVIGYWLKYALGQEFDFEWIELGLPPPPSPPTPTAE